MTETTSATGWNPIARRDPVTVPLKVAGVDDHDNPRATATYRPWSARERLRYEDLSLSLLGSDDEGNASVRMGRINALALTLTIESWTGFPETVERQVQNDHEDTYRTVVEPFDLHRIEHVELLGADVYGELARHARDVQPLPGFDEADEDETPESGPADPDDDGPLEAPAEDPSPTPSTLPVSTTSEVAPEPARILGVVEDG